MIGESTDTVPVTEITTVNYVRRTVPFPATLLLLFPPFLTGIPVFVTGDLGLLLGTLGTTS